MIKKTLIILFLVYIIPAFPQSNSSFLILLSSQSSSSGPSPGGLIDTGIPTDYANLNRFLAPGGIHEGGNPSFWDDSSGNAFDLNTATVIPDTATKLNGYITYSFNAAAKSGLNSNFATNVFQDLPQITWIGVVKIDNPSNNVMILDERYLGDGSGVVQISIQTSDSVKVFIRNPSLDVVQAGFSDSAYNNTWQIFAWTYDNGVLDVYSSTGKSQSATNLSVGTPLPSGSGFKYPSLGYYYNPTAIPGAYFNGSVAEDIVYGAIRSHGEINAICQHLASKYGLSWTNIP